MNRKLQVQKIIAAMFNNDDGNSLMLTGGQLDMVDSILSEAFKRIIILTCTQYGKSLSIAIAALLRKLLSHRIEKIPIIAPSREQAQIIMNYIIEFVLEAPDQVFTNGLLNVRAIERLKTQFSKRRLAWDDGSEIRVLTADASSSSQDIHKAGKSIMGHGGTTVIVDEAALISDVIMAKVLRMLGKNKDAKLVLIGNPFNQGYFYQASISDRYKKIKIDWQQAVREGRYTKEFIEEMRESMDTELFSILYDVDFILGSQDSYISQKDMDFGKDKFKTREGNKIKVGVDVNRKGKDKSVILIRKGSEILDLWEQRVDDTTVIEGELDRFHVKHGFDWTDVNIDVIGVGAGLVDSMNAKDKEVTGVSAAATPENEEQYYNLRAELYGIVKEEIRRGALNIFEREKLIGQLVAPKREYKTRKGFVVLKLESKDDMTKRGISSPDIADALALSYYESTEILLDSLSYIS